MLFEMVGICAATRVSVAATGVVLAMPPSAMMLPAGMVFTQLPEPEPSSTTSNKTSQVLLGGKVAPVMTTLLAPDTPVSTGLPPQVV